jgi:hypothetical protein
MKAIRFDHYGSPDVLELRDVDIPAVGDDELLVRVRAASVNPLDWHFMRGMPYVVRLIAGLARPKASTRKLGAHMAGSVEAVGKHVTTFKPGDEVFGGLEERGTLAEYIAIRADGELLSKRAAMSAGSVPGARRAPDRRRGALLGHRQRYGPGTSRTACGPRRAYARSSPESPTDDGTSAPSTNTPGRRPVPMGGSGTSRRARSTGPAHRRIVARP